VNGNVQLFAKKHKGRITGRVLEVGSYNVNGALRDTLDVTIGIDMRDGPGVDIVVSACKLVAQFGVESFDCVVSADALEHIEDWKTAMEQMWSVLKSNGVLLLTMANLDKGRHAYPDDYWRFPMADFKRLFGANEIVGEFYGGPSLGCCVIKTSPLDLSITPQKVP
jgi:SAM-dependent methyltransferase